MIIHDIAERNFIFDRRESMAYNGYAIDADHYLDAGSVTRKLDALIRKPVYSIKPEYLREYEQEYFDKKCQKSKEMTDEAKNVIPGGVEHNLALSVSDCDCKGRRKPYG